MSLPKKVHNLQIETPQTSNSINDSLNQPIRSPTPVNRKGRPPNKRLKSACEMAPKRKKTVDKKRTSSSNNVVSINLMWYASTLLFITWYMLITFVSCHYSAMCMGLPMIPNITQQPPYPLSTNKTNRFVLHIN